MFSFFHTRREEALTPGEKLKLKKLSEEDQAMVLKVSERIPKEALIVLKQLIKEDKLIDEEVSFLRSHLNLLEIQDRRIFLENLRNRRNQLRKEISYLQNQRYLTNRSWFYNCMAYCSETFRTAEIQLKTDKIEFLYAIGASVDDAPVDVSQLSPTVLDGRTGLLYTQSFQYNENPAIKIVNKKIKKEPELEKEPVDRSKLEKEKQTILLRGVVTTYKSQLHEELVDISLGNYLSKHNFFYNAALYFFPSYRKSQLMLKSAKYNFLTKVEKFLSTQKSIDISRVSPSVLEGNTMMFFAKALEHHKAAVGRAEAIRISLKIAGLLKNNL